jgi:predicted extracellular nuclease
MPQASIQESALQVFINELHYDNDGADTGERIEIAGLAGTNLAGWTLVLYNGNGGAPYATLTLDGVIPDQEGGYGALYFSGPAGGIQNGAPDGLALADGSGAVLQFLSYEGSFTAVGGPADGMASTDIGISEPAATPAGLSLQLTGSGTTARDFSWTAPADDSFGSLNAGQTFVPASGPGALSVADVSVVEGDEGTTELTFSVTRSGGASGTVSVDYVLGAGSADPADGGDTLPLPAGTLTFVDGQTERTITVEVRGDTQIEPDETLVLQLGNATGGATITTASVTGTIVNDDLALTSVGEIQGAGHISGLVGQEVRTTGVVTAVDTNGFYLQDPTGDGNAATSDAIFVFTGSRPTVTAGDALDLTGTVSEFTAGGASSGNLSTTQLGNVTFEVLSSGNALPQAVLIGPDGLCPPTEIIEDDGFTSFDPRTDGIDFYESLEGMRVTVQAPVAVAPTNSFGEITTVASDGAGDLLATNLSERGTVNVEGGAGGLGVTNQGAGSDFNPERIQVQADSGFTPGGTAGVPQVDAGAQLNDVTGVLSYGFGNYEVLATEAITVREASRLTPEVSALEGTEDRLLVASYNVLNLDPNDADGSTDVANGQFESIAQDIAVNLNTPDIIALQEVQDNDGASNTEVTSASETLQRLVDAIYTETGIRYAWIDNPFITDDASGGEPGGNIRTAFLYNPDRVDFVEGSLTTVVDPEDQATNPDNPFSDARLPLVATFEFNDREVTLINNHLSSKGGSTPLSGTTQPSLNGSEEQRAAQAQAVNDYVDGLLEADMDANVVVLGDLNEFEFEEPLQVLEGDLAYDGTGVTESDDVVLTNLTFQLAEDERYSYLFEGNSQAIDHILVSDGLRDGALYDAVHINTEFRDSSSDHDPVLASLLIPDDAAETLVGGNGRDLLDGADGDDLLTGGNAADILIGGRDEDLLQGGNGDDRLVGDDAADPLAGPDAGGDTLEGANGDDVLWGGGGADVLIGGRGDDVLTGGAGTDLFVFDSRGFGRDRIEDFTSGEDRIDLGGLGLALSDLDTSGDGVLDGRDRSVTLEGDAFVLSLRGGTIALAGVTALAANDLLL